MNTLRVAVQEKTNTKTDLLKAVQSQPLDKIKELVDTKGIPTDTTWLDYAALNHAIEQGRKDVALFLLEKKCRVNKVTRLMTKHASTPLHNAVKLGDKELVQKLLEKNASMTAVNSKSNSPLHLAFLLKHEKITDIILDFILITATFANPKNEHGLTHFHIACVRKNASLVLSYMKIASNLTDCINEDSPYFPGYTVMQFAIESRCPLILKTLLDNSGNHLKDQKESTLQLAKQYLQDMSLMVHLLSSHAQTNPQTIMSQFHIACSQNNPSMVTTFLDYGAVVNDTISEEAAFCPLYTPLHYAVETNCKESVEILLQRGADVDYQNMYYMTPLHLSLYNENQEIMDLLYASTKNKVNDRIDRNGLSYFHVAITRNDFDVVRKFLDRGQDVNARVFHNCRNFSGYTPLHFAVRYEHTGMAKLLIEKGANVNANDMSQHGTPLHMAFAAGHCGLIHLLLQNHSRVDVKRLQDGKTLLHLLVECYMDGAKRSKLLDYIELLVMGFTLDVNEKDKDGYTALHYACTKISVGAACAKILLEYGADINIENNVGDTPFELSFYDIYRNNAEDYMLLYNHVKAMETLGLTINPKNKECCDKLFREKDECQEGAECFRTSYLVKKQQETLNEVLRMKGVMVAKKTSMYQFLLMNEKELRGFQPTKLLKRLMEGQLIQEFVNFGHRLKVQWIRIRRLLGVNAT